MVLTMALEPPMVRRMHRGHGRDVCTPSFHSGDLEA